MENHINKTYTQLDDIGKFIKFGRKELVESIKESLTEFINNFDKLDNNFNMLKEENGEQYQDLKKSSKSLVEIKNKYNLLNKNFNIFKEKHLIYRKNSIQQKNDLENTKKILINIKRKCNILNKNFNILKKEYIINQKSAIEQKLNFEKIKEELDILVKKFDTLSNNFTIVKDNYSQEKENLKTIRKENLKTIDTLNHIENKYNLVSKFLDAKPLENDSLQKFKLLINDDFIQFANDESSLAEEAKALLLLQDVEKRLEEITSFPSIYNKNIVAVGGGFSAGKSEFLNSFFIDKHIKLPVGINPVTAIPTYITVGKTNIIKGYSYKGGVIELSSKLYNQLSHDFIKSLGFNLKDIAPIMAIETPMESYNNICFIDTPGYNPSNTGYSSNDRNTSKEYLEHANTLLWVIGIDTNGTIPASDLDFLENIALENKKIYIIANKADLRSSDDIEDILDIFEEILDDYDIEYEGISAFSSVHKQETTYRKESLFNFLEIVNNPVEIEKSILSELDIVFNMYRNAINEQIKWTNNIQSHFNSLELDLLESDIDNNEKIDERLEKMRNMFKTSSLKKQLKTLESLKLKIQGATKSIFNSLNNEI